MILHALDTLYNMRQNGKLSDGELFGLLQQGHISQWTYERLLSLKPDGTSTWSEPQGEFRYCNPALSESKEESDEDGSEFEGED